RGKRPRRKSEPYLSVSVDYMFDGLAKRKPQAFAVRQYAKYKLASGDVCSK
ncbi:conjugal transfer protein TraG, partial [[Clostridium] symbiosum]